MSSAEKPLIVISGALSKQGRSVTKSLLESGRYRVRALSGNIDSPEAKNLSQQGAELFRVPLALDHEQDFEAAFQGAQGVFLMTPIVLPPATHEFEIGRQQADAAVRAGVQHIVFSSLENVDKITGGTKYAPHFTDKGRVAEYISTLPVTSTFVELAFFYTNLLEYYTPFMQDDTLMFPIYLPEDFKAPFVDPLTATGPAVLEIFDHPEKYASQTLPVIGEILSPREIVEIFATVTGQKAGYVSAYDSDDFVRLFPIVAGNDDLIRETAGMVQHAVEYGYFRGDRDLEWSRRIDPNALTWERFLKSVQWDGQRKWFGL